MVEFEPGDSKAILRLLHPFQTEMFAEMTEEWCLLFLQSKSESVQDVTRHRWGLWTYVTVTCFVHAGACAILLKWASQVAGSLGVWRSLEARFLGMEEAPSSNLGTSTIEFKREASLNKGNLSNPSKNDRSDGGSNPRISIFVISPFRVPSFRDPRKNLLTEVVEWRFQTQLRSILNTYTSPRHL